MQYDKIKEYFSSDEKTTELLDILKKECFDIIDDYSQQFRQDIPFTSDELRQTKTILTGIVSTLNPIYSKALTLKKQKEYRRFVELKEAEGKFSAASAEKESKDFVGIYRDIRDVLFGYIKSAESLIFDCKDRLGINASEYKNTDK